MSEAVKNPEVVLAGQVCIDRNDIEGSTYVSWGSAVLYMSEYLSSSHDLHPTILASHGEDFSPYVAGLDLHPAEPVEAPTLVYENIIRNGRRTQFCRNADVEILPDIDEAQRTKLGRADMLIVAPLTDLYDADYVGKMISLVPEDCLKVLLPQGYLRQVGPEGRVIPRAFEEDTILSDFQLVIFSDEDMPDALGVAREWKRKYPQINIVVTQNQNGAFVIEADSAQNIPTIPVEEDISPDTIGCGDTFSAATAYHLWLSPGDIYAAVRKGNEAVRNMLLSARQAEPS